MIKKDQKLNYRYDDLADALFIYVIDGPDYEEAIELDSNIFLVVGDDNYPTALEILDASKVLDVQKFSLKRINRIHLKMCISNDKIIVECILNLLIHSGEEIKSTNSTIVNDMGLPTLEAELAMV